MEQECMQLLKAYKKGYVPGVFDLFHIGHLNLLKNCKDRCEYLVVGVLTDELVLHFKGKLPMIPYEERAAIIAAIRYVDEVVPVTFENTRKIDAWHQLHYDCHFSGNDHGPDWTEDFKQLQEVGATMEFFSYTKGVSSSALKNKMQGKELSNKLLLFGAGAYGRKLLNFLRNSENSDKWQVAGFLDNNESKHGTMVDGVKVYGLHQLHLAVPDGLFTVVIAVKETDVIAEQLKELGIQNVMVYQDFMKG